MTIDINWKNIVVVIEVTSQKFVPQSNISEEKQELGFIQNNMTEIVLVCYEEHDIEDPSR